MKELGEKLKEARKKNSINIEEASSDLNINSILLESLENGNFKAFKDVYELKNYIKIYAKYLGIEESTVLDEFNDFLFEKTSRITVEDIQTAREVEEQNKEKIFSPYTKIKPNKRNLAPLVFSIILLLFISISVYLVLNFIKNSKNEIHQELKSMEVRNEFTQ